MKNFLAASFFLLGLFAAANSQATLSGDKVNCDITGGGNFTCNVASATINNGVEFIIGNSTEFLSANFSNDLLTVTTLESNSLGGTILNFTDSTSAFDSESLIGSSEFTSFGASNVSLTGGDLAIDLIGTSSVTGAEFSIKLGSANNVPEPASLAIFGLGLAAIMVLARRKA
jgi:hypothetical protein